MLGIGADVRRSPLGPPYALPRSTESSTVNRGTLMVLVDTFIAKDHFAWSAVHRVATKSSPQLNHRNDPQRCDAAADARRGGAGAVLTGQTWWATGCYGERLGIDLRDLSGQCCLRSGSRKKIRAVQFTSPVACAGYRKNHPTASQADVHGRVYVDVCRWSPDFYHKGNVVVDHTIPRGGGGPSARLSLDNVALEPERMPEIDEWELLWLAPVGITYGEGHTRRGAGTARGRLGALLQAGNGWDLWDAFERGWGGLLRQDGGAAGLITRLAERRAAGAMWALRQRAAPSAAPDPVGDDDDEATAIGDGRRVRDDGAERGDDDWQRCLH